MDSLKRFTPQSVIHTDHRNSVDFRLVWQSPVVALEESGKTFSKAMLQQPDDQPLSFGFNWLEALNGSQSATIRQRSDANCYGWLT